MTTTVLDRFRIRRGTAADLAAVNEVPLADEFVYESDQGLSDGKYKIKIGDGSTHYNDLPYFAVGGGIDGIRPGTGINVDNTDPKNPGVSSTLGSIALSGFPATYSALPTGFGTGDAGKAYMVAADGLIYIWNGTEFPADGAGIVPGQSGHLFWRVYITSNTAANDFLNVASIQFRAKAGGADRTTPNGGVMTASSQFDTNSTPSLAFDRNDATVWGSLNNTKPQWVAYQFQTPIPVREVAISPSAYMPAIRSPGAFQIQYSDNGSTWTTAASFSGVTGWVYGTAKTFAVP